MRRIIPGFLIALLAAAGVGFALDQPRHLDEAIRVLKQRSSARPTDARAFNDLGNLLTLAGDTQRAEEAYRRAVELEPDDPTAHYNLGLLLRQMGRRKAAVRELQTVVKLDADDAWGHFQLGMLLEQGRKTQKAVDHLSQAFILDPELARLEVNPQLLDSKLVSRALTIAYTERVAMLESAPRQYRQPKRVTRLLVPETKPEATATTEAAEEGATVEEAPPPARKRPRNRRRPKDDGSGDSGGAG